MRQFERLDDQLGFGALLGGPLLDLDEQPRLTFDQLLVKALVAVASDFACEMEADEAVLLGGDPPEILAQRCAVTRRSLLVRAGASGELFHEPLALLVAAQPKRIEDGENLRIEVRLT